MLLFARAIPYIWFEAKVKHLSLTPNATQLFFQSLVSLSRSLSLHFNLLLSFWPFRLWLWLGYAMKMPCYFIKKPLIYSLSPMSKTEKPLRLWIDTATVGFIPHFIILHNELNLKSDIQLGAYFLPFFFVFHFAPFLLHSDSMILRYPVSWIYFSVACNFNAWKKPRSDVFVFALLINFNLCLRSIFSANKMAGKKSN